MKNPISFIFCFILFILFSLSSCEKEDHEKPLIEENLVCSIEESAPNGTIIDTVSLQNINDVEFIQFTIVGGDIEDAFSIDIGSGILRVKNTDVIDYESVSEYNLSIRVENSNNESSTGSITINIIDVKEILSSGLIAFYKADGTGNDVSGNNYHLINNGVGFTDDRDGSASEAFSFNGSSGLTLSGQNIHNQSEPQTISLWFKTSSLNSAEYGGLLFGILVSTGIGTGSRFFITMNEGIIRATYGDDESDGGANNQYLQSTQTYNDNNWHHIVFLSNGDDETAILYIDGIEIETISLSKSNNNNSSPTDIKLGGDKVKNYFIGEIDDVAWYNRALELDEVQQIFTEG